MLAVLVSAPLACGSLLGIDSGTPRGDASTVVPGDDSSPVAAIDGSDEGSSPADGGVPVERDAATEAGCTPDLTWCNTHCGTGPDNCGQTRVCTGDGGGCPEGESCVSNVCACESDPAWCTGRCGKTTDNCGNPVDCGSSCDGGAACYSNVCGCMPDPVATTCAGKECGQATNNCNLTVNCGVSGSTACAAGDYCQANDTCCVPNDTAACSGRCQVSINNNCGVAVLCPQTCPGTQECLNTACCAPSGCSANCVDNCGVASTACCAPDAGSPPRDAGSPPPDAGGGCGVPGSPCASGCCSSLLCGQSDTCVASCGTAGASCSSSNDCCFGLSCGTGGIQPLNASPDLSSLDGGIISLHTCQTSGSISQ